MAGSQTNNKKLSPFDYLNSINSTKIDLMTDREREKQYSTFMINRGLSYFADTVYMANEMNKYHHLDSKLQYHFLLNIVRKRKRFSKWAKADNINNIEAVKKYFGYSNDKAKQALRLLTADQITVIQTKVNQGGRK
tara:strand:- start:35637 stop:36044 length:408 start_codon:yes stop_codon:yes gene_type:complete